MRRGKHQAPPWEPKSRGRARGWVLLLVVSVAAGLLPLVAVADGDDSSAACTALAFSTSDGSSSVATATVPSGFIITEICIKSGEDAFGDLKHSGLITVDGTYGDYTVLGLGTSSVTVTSTGKDISHIDYNKVEEPDPKGEIEVTKTADLTYDKEHKWDITKNAVWKLDGSDVVNPVLLPADGSGDGVIKWLVDVTYEGAEFTNAKVTGSITIDNVGDLVATVESISDVLDTGEIGVVTCPSAPPFEIPVGDDVICTYVADLLGDPADGKNKVTVSGAFTDAETFEEEAKAYFDDEGPGSEVNETVNVKDLSSYFGYRHLGSVTAPDDGHFKYYEEFTYGGVGNCEKLEITNKALIKETGQKAYENVVIKTECLVFKGETATGDGKQWSKVSGAPNTWFEYSPFSVTDYDIVTGRKLVDIGDFTVDDLVGPSTELCFELDSPWELSDDAGNVKVQPLSGPPSAYIAPGQFQYHFNESDDEFCVEVPDASYGYAIHLDVGKWVSIGFGDLN